MDFSEDNLIKAMENNDMEFINKWKKRFNTPDSFFDKLIPIVQRHKEINCQMDLLAKLKRNLETCESTQEQIAWHKYICYCLEQLEKTPIDSPNYRYYQCEIAKAKSELDRL